MSKKKLMISLVCAFAGFMVAVQYKSMHIPTERDTRDLWEIRSLLQKEQKIQQQLLQQIAEAEKVLGKYEDNSEQELIETLTESINNLKYKAGLTEKTGSGVIIRISPIINDVGGTQLYPTLGPELLNRLINELFIYGATDIAVENERIVSFTPIRNVGGKTYVNNHVLPPVPVEIKVLANNPKRLLDHMEVSQSHEVFAIDYLELTAKLDEKLTLPRYDGVINFNEFHASETIETGEE